MLWSWDGFDYTADIDAKEISQGVKANSPQVLEHLPVVRIAPLATETTKAFAKKAETYIQSHHPYCLSPTVPPTVPLFTTETGG
ncbi:MAG: hypothetical protein ORN83_07120 [Chthoniobacteraceae bacterium]|nr:hypothetical protein [Chthoniobacteraceae bacterium]